MRFGRFCFSFRPFLYSDWTVLSSRFESYVRDVFNPRKGDVVFDVGAHIGLYTLIAAQKVGEGGLVVAFEPDRENFRLLMKNVRNNHFAGTVRLFQAALGNYEGQKMFFPNADPLISSFKPNLNSRQPKPVAVTTLDNVVAKFKIHHIDWIKIDVEGAEVDVLKGGNKTFADAAQNVIIEVSNIDALKFLAERGFKIRKLFVGLTASYFLAAKGK